MKDMHIDGFATALAVFDAALDEFANRQMSNSGHSCGRVSSTEPLEDGYVRYYPVSVGTYDPCTTSGESHVPNVRFDNIIDDVQQVIFNDPATIVTFSDGSKVCVKACSKDTFSKETGLIYAIIKRLYANDVEEKTGYLRSSGLGEKIAKLIKNAIDQKEQERERRRKQKAKQAKKAAHEPEKAKMANEVPEKAVEQIYEDDKKD